MKKLIYLMTFALLLGGCYADKGNYDYREINEIEVGFTPDAASYDAEHYTYAYTYRQPAIDPLSVTYTAQATQSRTWDDANLAYEWIVTKNGLHDMRDTVRTRELTLEFEPKTKTAYDVRFRLTDTDTGIDLYRTLRMTTEVPFVRSWFVLHGKPGQRQLGTVEYPDDSERTEVLADAFGAMHEQPNQFANVNGMIYTAFDGSDFSAPEHLTLLESDKAYYMNAFDLTITAMGYNLMVPDPAARIKLSYGITNNSNGRNSIIVTEERKFIHCGMNGFYYNPLTQPEVEDYRVDLAYMSRDGNLTIWDKTMKRFMYYSFAENWYPWPDGEGRPEEVYANALLTPFPTEIFTENEMNNRDVMWIGHAINSATESGGVAVVVDNTANRYWAYMFGVGGKDDKDGKDGKGDDGGGGGGGVFLSRQELTGTEIGEGSHFATSVAFAEQIFYSSDNVVYHYNMVTGENKEIYTVDPGVTITDIQFRLPDDHYMLANENRKLAVVTLSADGQNGQLHELTFNQSGDVAETVIFDGDFGPIHDIAFSFIHRIIR